MGFNTEKSTYRSLRNILTERTSEIVFWVGSGLSVPAGLPTWTELRNDLVEACQEVIEDTDEPDATRLRSELESLKNEDDHWIAFERIEKIVGPSHFRTRIKHRLSPASSVEPPPLYAKIWQLGLKGLVTLNLDRLSTRSFVKVHELEPLEFSGLEVRRASAALNAPNPFILNLHGDHEDAESWVFTQKQLNHLRKSDRVKTFIQTLLQAYVNVFVGVSLDDIALSDYLKTAVKNSPGCGPHFWITARGDLQTREWADSIDAQVIRYWSKDGDHSELDEIFDDLLSYVPEEETHPPIASQRGLFPGGGIPEPEELSKQPAEEIRRILNAHAQQILESGTEKAYEEFDRFCQKYDPAIYRAWYTSDKPGQNDLLGYRLIKKEAKGAFGSVYRAESAERSGLAVKVLHEDVRENPNILQSFRRGVHSMRILSEAGVNGMVPYIDASEIPAFVVMDWIDGPNLKEAVESGFLAEWSEILEASHSIIDIVRRAHRLPQRVLHRDIRPQNIMLKDYYQDPNPGRIVVLDFDLSWHMGAEEKSVIHGSTSTGYLAPEQIQRRVGVSTRHASVDSFGLGMTFFFIVAKQHPFPTQHSHGDWEETVFAACNRVSSPDWRSLPNRFARLILNATKDKQARRWDIGQMEAELDRLKVACLDPGDIDSPDLLVEELLSRTKYARDYKFSQETVEGLIALHNGARIMLKGDFSRSEIYLKIDWSEAGSEKYANLKKWIPDAVEKAESILKKTGWKLKVSRSTNQYILLEAAISARSIALDVGKSSEALQELGGLFSFS